MSPSVYNDITEGMEINAIKGEMVMILVCTNMNERDELIRTESNNFVNVLSPQSRSRNRSLEGGRFDGRS